MVRVEPRERALLDGRVLGLGTAGKTTGNLSVDTEGRAKGAGEGVREAG